MPDPEIVNPLPKPIQTAETEIAKVVAFWRDYRLYFVAIVCLIVGGIIGHKI